MLHRWTGACVAGLLGLAMGCGGGQSEAQTPATAEPAEADESESSDVLIPAEKFDEIKSTFERKQPIISRCFVAGVDAGEIEEKEKGYVTVAVTITPSGKPTGVNVSETSFKSKALEECVVSRVSTWVFTELPEAFDYTYTYRLERF